MSQDEYTELLEFLYQVPIAVMKASMDGEIKLANPESVRILAPITGTVLPNLFTLLSPVDPELHRLVADAERTGPVCRDRRVHFLAGIEECILAFDVFLSARQELLISFKDVTESVRFEMQLERMSRTDELTGLYNRRHLVNVCEAEFPRAQRHGRELSLIMCDVDFFKQVNDSHGHDTGDAVLREIGRIFQRVCRASDLCVRLGGEEFAVLLPETAMAGAMVIAERLRVDIENASVRSGDVVVQFMMSFGVAERTDDESLDSLLKKADTALYEAKGSGRNRVCRAPDDELV